MTYQEEQELLNLTRENNVLLKYIALQIKNNNSIDFTQNVVANLLANRMEQIGGFYR